MTGFSQLPVLSVEEIKKMKHHHVTIHASFPHTIQYNMSLTQTRLQIPPHWSIHDATAQYWVACTMYQ